MSGPLLDLSGLTKPATVLIERIADAVGGLAKPWQIERVARAEGRAEVIRAESQMQVTEFERRAIRRLVVEEGRKQENIEAIATQATLLVTDAAKPEEMSTDWLVNFFEHSRLTSDAEMQNLWAKILAGAANHPGSFSRRTVDLVSIMEKSDAELVERLTKMVVWFKDYDDPGRALEGFSEPYAIVLEDIYTDPDGAFGFRFNDIRHITELGLLTFRSGDSYQFGDLPKEVEFMYGEKGYSLILPKTNSNSVGVGPALFTKAGKELMRVVSAQTDDAYFQAILNFWRSRGYSPACKVL